MWILLNDKPIRVDSITNIGRVREYQPDKFAFRIDIDGEWGSCRKHYHTFEEAEIARNLLLTTINTIIAGLPKLEI